MRRIAILLFLAMLSSCDEGTPPATTAADTTAPGPTAGAEGEAVLGANYGIVFDTGEVKTNGNHLTADLMAYKNKSGLDLKSGVPQGTTSHQPLKVIIGKGGLPATFGSIDEVPVDLPTDADANLYARAIESGQALILQNNISDGYTVVWVKSANEPTDPRATIQYRVILPAN